MNTSFAGFELTLQEEIIVVALSFTWVIFCAFMAIVALHLLFLLVSKLTKKDVSIRRIFKNRRRRQVCLYTALFLTIVTFLLLTYYVIIAN